MLDMTDCPRYQARQAVNVISRINNEISLKEAFDNLKWDMFDEEEKNMLNTLFRIKKFGFSRYNYR